MRDRPSGPELLWQARRVLLDELLDALPEGKRYDALMIAAAMATAAREGETGDAPLRAAWAALAELTGDRAATPPGDPQALQEDLDRRLRALAGAIRDGRHDGESGLHAALLRMTADRLREANPKHLARRQGG
jgi:hypothetical protein